MRILSWLTVLALLCVFAGPAIADGDEATISLSRDPEPPYCILNPGGVETISWEITHETTPNYVYYKLEDTTRTIILEDSVYLGYDGLVITRLGGQGAQEAR